MSYTIAALILVILFTLGVAVAAGLLVEASTRYLDWLDALDKLDTDLTALDEHRDVDNNPGV